MTVRKDHGQWVDIHDYSPDVGVDPATNDAAFAWAMDCNPTWAISLRPDSDYAITKPVDMRGRTGKHLIGRSSLTTIIRQTTAGEPVIRMGDTRKQRVQGVGLFGNGVSGYGIEFHGNSSYNTVSDISTFNTEGGISIEGAQWFSNTLEDIQIGQFTDWGLRLNGNPAGDGALGTGNRFDNVYINAAAETVEGGVWLKRFTENSFNQLNIENMTTADYPLRIEESSAQTFQSTHFELVNHPEGSAHIGLFGFDVSQAEFSGLRFDRSTPPTGTVFNLGRSAQANVETVSFARGFEPTGPYHIVEGIPDGFGAQPTIHIEDWDDPGGNITPTVQPGTTPRQVIREFNDEWDSLVAPNGTVYRIEVDNAGALQTTAV